MFRVYGVWFRVWGLRIRDVGVRGYDQRLRVEGLGFRV